MFVDVIGQKGSSAIAIDAGRFDIKGVGTVQFQTRVGGERRAVQLENTKFIPSFD